MLYSRQSCQVLEPFASSSLQWSIARSILLHDATKDKFSKYENWRHKLHKIARWGIFQGWWKLLSVFYTFTLRFWFVIFPRFILSATRVITGPNIVITSFSLCRHTLTFFNSLLNPVIYGWRMRQIRHAIMDSLQRYTLIVNCDSGPWDRLIPSAFQFSIGIFWHSVFHLMFVEIRLGFPLFENFRWKLYLILASFVRYQSGSVLLFGSVRFWTP